MPGIVHLSEAVLIAVHAMAVVAQNEGAPVSTAGIARCIHSSENHLAKVMQRLVRGGLIDSRRGPAGGFTLRKKPGEITVLDIFKVIEGEDENEKCLFHHKQCVFNGCIFGNVLDRIEKDFREYMKNNTLADFKRLEGSPGEDKNG